MKKIMVKKVKFLRIKAEEGVMTMKSMKRKKNNLHLKLSVIKLRLLSKRIEKKLKRQRKCKM